MDELLGQIPLPSLKAPYLRSRCIGSGVAGGTVGAYWVFILKILAYVFTKY